MTAFSGDPAGRSVDVFVASRNRRMATQPSTHRRQARGRIASISDKAEFANETLPEIKILKFPNALKYRINFDLRDGAPNTHAPAFSGDCACPATAFRREPSIVRVSDDTNFGALAPTDLRLGILT
ncbi:hypothetical protein [Bradyrhizobium vignae]|uniref:hypothetical protein n=1 Tax=Bradyrhizobium vignae TaxID=1549949 RepID=UPI00100A3D15|nr:hypothetical protein [Bradyrhizobium vignae]RXH05434.1 hypothetical protein EAV90_05655 [Bradyrhizobium vignae]